MTRKRIMFTWEIREKAKGRRWFYLRLKRLLRELDPKNWRKLGGSVYVTDEECSHELETLLKSFDGADLKWYRLKIKT
jgi:hypothetical protein